MAVQSQTTPPPADLKAFRERYGPVALAIGMVGLSFLALLIINRSDLMFPLWSSIAFPVLAAAPFVVIGMRIPWQLKLFLALLVGLIMIPYLGLEDSFYLELATQIAIFGCLALGLNIVVGFAGLLDLGYVAFFAVGAYLWGVFSSQADTLFKQSHALAAPDLFYPFLFVAIAAAGVTGILLGLPVLRLRGDYLAIVTLGFGEMTRILISNLSNISGDPSTQINITNGAQGLYGIADPPLPQIAFDALRGVSGALNIHVNNPTALTYQYFFYFLALVIGGAAVIMAARLDNSPIGRAWTAIREDETAAIAMGVPLVRMKLMAFATGAAFAGAMGVVFAAKQTFVSPETFSFEQSIFALAIVIVGGMGNIRGVLLGAVVVTLLNIQVLTNLSLLINNFKNNLDQIAPFLRPIIQGWPTQLELAKYQRLVFGALLVVMMIFRPTGILPARRRQLEIQEALGKDEGIEGGHTPPTKQEAANA